MSDEDLTIWFNRSCSTCNSALEILHARGIDPNMAANPILIERPVVVKGTRAVIGRPPERVVDVLA